MHERNEDKSWTFRTANSEGTVNPVPLPQSLTVQYTVKRTMRLVIQAPPAAVRLAFVANVMC